MRANGGPGGLEEPLSLTFVSSPLPLSVRLRRRWKPLGRSTQQRRNQASWRESLRAAVTITGTRANQNTADTADIEPPRDDTAVQLCLTLKMEEPRSPEVNSEIEKTAMRRLKETYPEFQESDYYIIMEDPEAAARVLEIVLEPIREGIIHPPLTEEFNSFDRLVALCTQYEHLREWLYDGALLEYFDWVGRRG
ncbi:hypothetical protein BV20DRAFT_975350, partial [Pilatotrama ljubarskyi]